MTKKFSLTLEFNDSATPDDIAAAFENAGNNAAVEIRYGMMGFQTDNEWSIVTNIDRCREATLMRVK